MAVSRFEHRNKGFPDGSEVKASAYNAGDLGLIPGSGRSPGEGNGNPLQFPCQENPMDGGAWWAIVHGVTKNHLWPLTKAWFKPKSTLFYLKVVSLFYLLMLVEICKIYLNVSVLISPSNRSSLGVELWGDYLVCWREGVGSCSFKYQETQF